MCVLVEVHIPLTNFPGFQNKLLVWRSLSRPRSVKQDIFNFEEFISVNFFKITRKDKEIGACNYESKGNNFLQYPISNLNHFKMFSG